MAWYIISKIDSNESHNIKCPSHGCVQVPALLICPPLCSCICQTATFEEVRLALQGNSSHFIRYQAFLTDKYLEVGYNSPPVSG